METLYSVFSEAEDGDKILVKFPDLNCFYHFVRWFEDNFGKAFWILWTDAAVERINHLGKKFGLEEREGVIIGSGKNSRVIKCLDRLDIYSDLSIILKVLPLNKRYLLSFGVDFLTDYGHPMSRLLDIIVEHEHGVLINAVFKKIPEDLYLFHDVVVEFKLSEENVIKYKGYVAKIIYPIETGVAEVSEPMKFSP